jgi:heme/copper-type cytochrome/quinol oxidase subunit 1
VRKVFASCISTVHSLVRRYIKTAVGFLLLGLAIGTHILIRRELYLTSSSQYEISAHTHAILVGFVMMMILGVALWLFPRERGEEKRYDPRAANAAYWMITIGTAARIAGELARVSSGALWLRLVVVVGGVAQFAGIAVFFFTMWPRIRSAGSHVREARGERF